VVARSQLGRRDVAPQLAEEAEPVLAAIFVKAFVTVLIFGWSGATPARTRPKGVGSTSSTSTSKPATSSCPEA